MTRSTSGPFVIRARNVHVMIRKAGFGISTFPNSRGALIDLMRKSISLRARARGHFLGPNRATAFGQGALALGMRGSSMRFTSS